MEKKTQFSRWHFSFTRIDIADVAGIDVTRYGMLGELGDVVYDQQRSNFLGQAAPLPEAA